MGSPGSAASANGHLSVVEKTYRQKTKVQQTRNLLLWIFINLLLFSFIYFDITFGTISGDFMSTFPLFWYLEYGLAFCFALAAILDFIKFVYSTLSLKPVELTERQRRLLGVRDSDTSFQTVNPVPKKSAEELSPVFNQSTMGRSFGGYSSSGSPSSHLTPSSHYSGSHGQMGGSPTLSGNGPLQISGYGTSASMYGHVQPVGSFSGSRSFLDSSVASRSFTDPNQNMSFSTSFNKSMAPSPLSTTCTLSPLFREAADTSGLRSRVPASRSPRNSPLNSDECITDIKAFQTFIRDQEEKELKSHLASPENMSVTGTSFWNYNRTLQDFSPVMRKYQYQIAPRSTLSTKSKDHDPDDPCTYRADEVFDKIGAHPNEVDRWVENVRRWLSQTIMSRLSRQIRNVNEELINMGMDDMQIGEISIATLKQLAITKGNYLSTLNRVIPFLDLGSNQEYIVKRIGDLGAGGCMSDFRWSSGIDFKGKPWGEHFPTDAAIVMHMFCTYLDARLPPHPKYPDGKTFTSQHFLKTPDKPNLTKKDNLQIYQSSINPPHFKVILGDDIWDVPKGRNNMFHAILLFIHYLKTKQNGMLGQINLGLSGINILWVLDS